MTRTFRRRALSVCAAVALAGCDSSLPPPPAGSKYTAETLATQETPEELQFKGTLAGKPIHLLMHECKVYKVDPAEGDNVAWTLVLEGDFYPLPTICVRQELTVGKGFIKAFIGRQAFGAGGCCTGTPEYRSTDGLTWKPR
ncbi:hypothetical protein LMG3458_04453 [Achromobacter deleyi]|uniref:Lipoprotein n=1 Tax=Achromobacter deleyi TaxID=1353891 RepID=A0A6S7AES8_9BURK|nr:hypothetical protein [Achromobacter deleyi]CAB3726576.1 hypothetical protein LMG3458_04453 [Achromobacter deleyi]CAB3926616.1 hypothetical protein LMG3481_05929 [Achromobacter deleyi]CAB3927558.1 hypothetical protein LMG3482_06146 [Achromobacter deleyi]